MARVDHLAGGIYRISTYAPEKRISFNQFLIHDDEPTLIHTGTFPMYADVRAAIAQVLDPSRLRYVIVPHFEADECGGMGRFVAEAPQSVLACSAVGARINLQQWDYTLLRACRTATCSIWEGTGCASGKPHMCIIGIR
jgi:flavorubredoxin